MFEFKIIQKCYQDASLLPGDDMVDKACKVE